jgi:sialate O-acetylesterase
MKKSLPLVAFLISSIVPSLRGDVAPSPLFSDNAVLQQGIPLPVWGTASENEQVTVEISGQKVSTTAKDGRWMLRLAPLKASSEPLTMTISGNNTLTFKNILVGEVWLCGGQSNMERQLGLRSGQKPLENWEQEAASANYPQIRQFLVKPTISNNPNQQLTGTWQVCSPESAPRFTAVGYYFGRDLHKHLGVPVGLINSTWGGTPAESWMSVEALQADPALAPILEKQAKAIQDYPAALATYRSNEPRLKAEHEAACAAAQSEAKPTPRPPAPPRDPLNNPQSPCVLFNGMINPLLPYGIKGAIWYQGEGNRGKAMEYRTLFPALIADWRRRWQLDSFPFLYVQLAPFQSTGPDIREAQLLTLKKSPRTAMAVITDHGDAKDIHPTEKEPVGQRLALAARAIAYGESIEYSGPLYEDASREGNAMVLRFSHLGTGLQAKGGPLIGFTIAGADQKFVPAQAEIKGQTVVVSSPSVSDPVAVRYGWANVPECNLFNFEGLPASPFRTDDWSH